MNLYRTSDYESMSRKAAAVLSAQITLKPDSVLGLATGSTPEGLYRCLVDWYQKGNLDFSNLTSVNLDEYRGLPGDHEQSYRYFMDHHLFNHVNIDKSRTFVPNGLAEDIEASCAAYDQLISDLGGVDLQLLGLGHNGHIGFNEPGDHFDKGTHCVDLSPQTINANKRFFASEADVPRQAFSMGIQTIMRARKILLVVSGAEKADALQKVIQGPITPQVPGSVLQLHSDVTVVADEAALSKMK